jgi:hypothetical protein
MSLKSEFIIVGVECQVFVATDSGYLAFENVRYRTTCVLLLKSPSGTLRLLEEAYGKVAMKKTRVYEWHKCFHDGRASVSDDPPGVRT